MIMSFNDISVSITDHDCEQILIFGIIILVSFRTNSESLNRT